MSRFPKSLADEDGRTLKVAAATIALWTAVGLVFHVRMFNGVLGASAWGLGLQGAALAGAVGAAVACLAELRRRRTGAGFLPTFGRGLAAAGAAGFACLLAGFAWGVRLLAVEGAVFPGPSLMGRVPSFGMVAALLPAGACLCMRRRGRVDVYVCCAALAVAGVAVYVRCYGWFDAFHRGVDPMEPMTLPLADAVRACAVGLAPRLAALWAGLGAAWFMESSARRAAGGGSARERSGVGWGRLVMFAACGFAAAAIALWFADGVASWAATGRAVGWQWAFVELAVAAIPLVLGLLTAAGRVWPGACAVLGGLMTVAIVLVFGTQDGSWPAGVASAAYFVASLHMLFAEDGEAPRPPLRPCACALAGAFLLSAAWQVAFHSQYDRFLGAVDPALRAPAAALIAAAGAALFACMAFALRRRPGGTPVPGERPAPETPPRVNVSRASVSESTGGEDEES